MPKQQYHNTNLLKTTVLLLCFLFVYHSNAKCTKTADTCIENIAFGDTFFNCIKTIENFESGVGYGGYYRKSLYFIGQYVKVSTEKMLNYPNTYTTFNDFKNDKENWLKWYEENKCNNIQICYPKLRKRKF